MVKVRQRAKFRDDRSKRCGDMAIFRFFQDGGSPPSWICYAGVWTTHKDGLITVQNLVGKRCTSLSAAFRVPRCKDWLTSTARVPCSNAANIGERKTWTQSEFWEPRAAHFRHVF